MAPAISRSDTTIAPSMRPSARSHMLGKTALPPIPSTKEGRYSTVRGAPAMSEAESGAAVSTSAA